MARLLRPRALPRGGTIAIAAPAFWVEPVRVYATAERLLAAGHQVTWREDLFARSGYLAGDAARRGAELMQWVRDDSVHAILCARGGWGCHHVIPRLDARAFRAARKPLIGFSDITTLLGWQREVVGLAGVHGPMCVRDDGPTHAELRALLALLAGEKPAPLRGRGLARGRVEGPLVGGSLTLVADSLGTPWEIDTRGAILCLEEIGEKPYAIDRQLSHLHAAGKLDAAAGFAIGHFIGCVDPKRARPTAQRVILELLGGRKKPLVTGLRFGHVSPNLPWPLGIRGRLDGGKGELAVLEPAVD
ncbi:MAG: LD-carboxypeptidase [Myxococcota bacterium]